MFIIEEFYSLYDKFVTGVMLSKRYLIAVSSHSVFVNFLCQSMINIWDPHCPE